MIVFRYLAREVFTTLTALTAILMLIFASNQLILYLNRAVSGNIPGVIIVKLMMFELPNLAVLLVPLGFYMALLLTYGRLYADSEMTVLRACGYGSAQLLLHSFMMAGMLAVFVAILSFWGSPIIATQRAKLLHVAGVQTLIQTIMPGRFNSINQGNQVFYVQSSSRDHSKAEQVFLAKRVKDNNNIRWDVVWANKAFTVKDPNTEEDYLVLQSGKFYQGVPGQANYQVTEFAQYKARLPHQQINLRDDIRTYPTASLWPLNNPDLAKVVELQWRFSIPIMVLVLTLVAVPLSRVSPRSGKFANLLPAIIVYILYANGLFILRDAVGSGRIPAWLGLWSIHFVVALLGFVLIWRNHRRLS